MICLFCGGDGIRTDEWGAHIGPCPPCDGTGLWFSTDQIQGADAPPQKELSDECG